MGENSGNCCFRRRDGMQKATKQAENCEIVAAVGENRKKKATKQAENLEIVAAVGENRKKRATMAI